MQELVTRKKELSLSEKQIESQILEYLEHLPGCFAWKNQSVGVFDTKKQIFRKSKNKFHINGVSDILGVFQGRMLAIEVKRPSNKKRTDDQNHFVNMVNRYGGISFYATSVEEVKHQLNQIVENKVTKSNETRPEFNNGAA